MSGNYLYELSEVRVSYLHVFNVDGSWECVPGVGSMGNIVGSRDLSSGVGPWTLSG